MEITRDVILDLLPLYLADEVSADTRALVEKFLETDPELAEIAKQSATMDLSEDIPIPLTKENEMEAYEEAKRLLFRRTVIWAALIAFALLSCLGLALLAYFMLFSVI
jgi:anti-sigma factor RsiW